MNPIIKVLILTLCINIVAFISMGDNLWQETFVGNSQSSLLNTTNIDLQNPQSIEYSSNVNSITGTNLTTSSTVLGTGSELVYTNSLSVAWKSIQLFFTLFFALPVLFIQMQLPGYVTLMVAIPIAFIYLFSIIFFIRGVNP